MANGPLLQPQAPRGHFIVTLLLFSFQGQVKVQGKCHYKWRFLIIGQNVCPLSYPTSFTSILSLPRLPFSAIAESQPAAVYLKVPWVTAAVRPSQNNPQEHVQALQSVASLSIYSAFNMTADSLLRSGKEKHDCREP